MWTVTSILFERCFIDRIRVFEELYFWEVVTSSDDCVVLWSFDSVNIRAVCERREDTLNWPAEGKSPAWPFFILELASTVGYLFARCNVEKEDFVSLTKRLECVSIQWKINELDRAWMFPDLFKRREILVRIIRNNELIMASLCTYRAIRCKLNNLNSFSRTVSTFSGYFEVLIQHKEWTIKES